MFDVKQAFGEKPTQLEIDNDIHKRRTILMRLTDALKDSIKQYESTMSVETKEAYKQTYANMEKLIAFEAFNYGRGRDES